MLRVTVDLFSGRPNPTWIITDEDYAYKLLSQLSELADYIRDPDEAFPGLGFRGIQLQSLGDDEQGRRLPGRFAIATGRSEEPPEIINIAGDILGSMARFSKVRFPDHELTPLDTKLQDYILKRFEEFRAVHVRDWVIGILRPCPLRKTVPDPDCRDCEYEESRFNPGFWNTDPQVRLNNNCYNYARNWRTDTFAQPGRASGNWPNPMACGDVAGGAMSDGLVQRCNCLPQSEYPRRLVALVVDPGWDYHWYRKQCGGFWGHKPGSTPARNTDNSSVLITDPETCDRGGYTDFCGYFYAGKSVVIT